MIDRIARNAATPWRLALVALALCWVAPDLSASGAEEHPGYVRLETLNAWDRDDELKIEVQLHDGLLRLVGGAVAKEDPELSDALSKLASIRFLLYDLDGDDLSSARSRVRKSLADLKRRGWDRIVQIQDEGSTISIYVKWDEDQIIGLTAMFSDSDGELGMINIAGSLDPDQIARIGQRFDIDFLDQAQQALEDGTGRNDD